MFAPVPSFSHVQTTNTETAKGLPKKSIGYSRVGISERGGYHAGEYSAHTQEEGQLQSRRKILSRQSVAEGFETLIIR